MTHPNVNQVPLQNLAVNTRMFVAPQLMATAAVESCHWQLYHFYLAAEHGQMPLELHLKNARL